MILITRSYQQSITTAGKIGLIGKEYLIEPLSIIQPYPFNISKEHFDAIVITSQNAIMPISSIEWIRDIRTFAIGSKTTHTLESYGFNDVTSGDSDVYHVINQVKENIPKGSKLLYLRGDIVKTDIKNILTDYEVVEAITYKTTYKNALSSVVLAVWDNITYVLFYSGWAAKTFKIMAKNHFLSLSNIKAVCISQNAADELSDLHWKEILVAATPNESSILELLK